MDLEGLYMKSWLTEEEREELVRLETQEELHDQKAAFDRKVREEMKTMPQLRLDEDGDFLFESDIRSMGVMAEDELMEILMDKNPGAKYEDWVDERYEFMKEETYADIEHEVTKNLEHASEESLTEDQETWLHDYVRMHLTFQLSHDQILDQKVQADVFVDTGDSEYSFSLNSNFLDDPESYEDILLKPKPSIVWFAETLGYSEKQLIEELKADTSGKRPSADSSGEDSFIETLKHPEISKHAVALVFLAELTVGDLVRINSKLHERDVACPEKEWTKLQAYPNNGTLHMKRGTTAMLLDPWFTGKGSYVKLEMEEEIDLPLKYAYSILPDGAEGKYSVRRVFDLPETAWRKASAEIPGYESAPAEEKTLSSIPKIEPKPAAGIQRSSMRRKR